MTRTRNMADSLDANGDVKTAALRQCAAVK